VTWSVSEALRRAVHAQETDEVFLVLVTIEHPELQQIIRVSSDAVHTVSRGETYLAIPFDLQLPEDGEDRPPRARLTIDNVSREIVLALRQIQAAPTVTMEVVRASEPDLVEASFPFFRLQDVRYDALVVEGELGVEDLTSEPFPAARFVPSLFPGLF
jgi:hypothetical protein